MQKAEFDRLYREHGDMVFNLALNYLQNREDAEEVTQDVFVKVYHHFSTFNNQSSLKTWIYRITLNQCNDRLKSSKAAKRSWLRISLPFFSEEQPFEPAVFDHPGVKLEHKEELKQAFASINALPSNQRTALILRVMEDLSVKEIADAMKLSPKAVESLLSRARKKLTQPKDE